MGTAVPLLTARVWMLYGGDGFVSTGTGLLSAGVRVRRGVDGSLSTRTGLLSAGVGVRWIVAGSLPNGLSVQSGRVLIMCGSLWASTTMVLSASTGSTIFSEDRVVTPLDTATTLSNSNG